MLFSSTAFLLLAAALPADPGESAFFPPKLYLVRATPKRIIKPEKGLPRGRFLITHVYAGPKELADGGSFEYDSTDSAVRMGSSKRGTSPLDRRMYIDVEATEGLWWLRADGNLKPERRAEVVDTFQIRRFPFQNGRLVDVNYAKHLDPAKEYKEGLAWAEAIEAVYRAKSDDDREALLRRLAAGEGATTAPWAIAVLGKANRPGTAEFLKGLPAKVKFSTESQTALDGVLSRIDPQGWRSSDERRLLVSGWLQAPEKDPEAFGAGCNRLLSALRSKEIDFALYAKVLDPFLATADKLSRDNAGVLARTLVEANFAPKDRAEAFAWLTGYVRDGKTVLLRYHAAQGLGGFRPFTGAEAKAVRALRESAKDEEVKTSLDGVLGTRFR